MSDLLELAERCEKATGPSQSIDADIRTAMSYTYAVGSVPPFYTHSLDAARSLVPEGWYVGDLTECNEDDEPQCCLTQIEEPCRDAGAVGATLALALCAAALRARATIGRE